jgi:hypothetical protein
MDGPKNASSPVAPGMGAEGAAMSQNPMKNSDQMGEDPVPDSAQNAEPYATDPYEPDPYA